MENLRKLRKQKRISQVSLSIKTGIDQSLLSKYERGVRQPSVDNLTILADLFHTSTDYLLDRTDEIKPYDPK